MPPIPIGTEQSLLDRIDRSYAAVTYDTQSEPQPQTVLQPDEQLVEPLPAEENFEKYAEIADQSYKEDRVDLGLHRYLQDLSTEDHAVYESPDEVVVGVRGTSPKTPRRDFARDVQVALGSAAPVLSAVAGLSMLPTWPGAAVIGTSALGALDPLSEGVDQVGETIDKVKKALPGKKVHVTGHSLGGTIASLYGIDNPDVNVSTFNKGEGLPFISSAIKCTISGCKNISNYRIAGDFASLGSKISNVGSYETLRPVRPTQETREEAELAGGFFIEPELYLPHSASNFIGRSSKKELSSNIYARPLAAKIGRVAGAVLPIAANYALNKYGEFTIKRSGEDGLQRWLEEEEFPEGLEQDVRAGIIPEEFAPQVEFMREIEEETARRDVEVALRPARASIESLAGQSFLGRSAGELAGLAFYESLLAE